MDNKPDKSYPALPTFSRRTPTNPQVAAEAPIAEPGTPSSVLTKCCITIVILGIYTCLHGASLTMIAIHARHDWLADEKSLGLGDFVHSVLGLVSAYLMVGIVANRAAPVLMRVASRDGVIQGPETKKELMVVLSMLAFVALSFIPAGYWWFTRVLWFASLLWSGIVVGVPVSKVAQGCEFSA